MKVPLPSSSYRSRSIIAAAQRCVNLYPEKNPDDAPFPNTYYQTPGLTLLSQAPKSGFRAMYTATTGALCAVVNDTVYLIQGDYTFKSLGTLSTDQGAVSMIDNGISLVLVDGSPIGKQIDLVTGVMTDITNAAFYGANRVDLVDGYLIFNRPNSNQFYISAFLDVDFDSLDFAAKTGFSDTVVAVAAAKRQIFVFGTQTTEVWYNTGDADFTFGRMPGAFIQHGCVSAASIAQTDGSLYWLSESREGECLVLRTEGYDRARVSTFAIEKAFQSYVDVTDARGFIYQQEGHTFYILNFPRANKTWAYDIASDEWHERMWLDDQGAENRHRAGCYAFFNGKILCGDWENSNLYLLDPASYTDNGDEIRRIRSFPHLMDNGNRVMYQSFSAQMQVGDGIPDSFAGAELRLRYSDSRGTSWGTYIAGTLAAQGNYNHSCNFWRLGMARDRIFELSWASNCPTALNGAFVNVLPAGT